MKEKRRVRNGAAGLCDEMRVAHEPAERFARMDDNAVFARRHAVLDRMARDDGKTGRFVQWAREDPNAVDPSEVR